MQLYISWNISIYLNRKRNETTILNNIYIIHKSTGAYLSNNLYSIIYYGSTEVEVGEPFSITCIIPVSEKVEWIKDGEPIKNMQKKVDTDHMTYNKFANVRHNKNDYVLTESDADFDEGSFRTVPHFDFYLPIFVVVVCFYVSSQYYRKTQTNQTRIPLRIRWFDVHIPISKWKKKKGKCPYGLLYILLFQLAVPYALCILFIYLYTCTLYTHINSSYSTSPPICDFILLLHSDCVARSLIPFCRISYYSWNFRNCKEIPVINYWVEAISVFLRK